jgi:hypothetical protein
MKTTILHYFVITIILFSFIQKSHAQENHIITLYVNTDEILKPNVNPYCDFGQTDGSSNENYTITANIGYTIIWRGKSTSSSEDRVNITSINHRGGKNVFDRNVINGNGADPEEVMGTILYTTIDKKGKKDLYKYTIKFTVYNNGVKRNGMFQIDPKLRVPK